MATSGKRGGAEGEDDLMVVPFAVGMSRNVNFERCHLIGSIP